LDLL
ncbi:hypothetical protein D034_2893B, partial [Vibrio parahaemolyticus Peru-288]|jgi:hypothetical protein